MAPVSDGTYVKAHGELHHLGLVRPRRTVGVVIALRIVCPYGPTPFSSDNLRLASTEQRRKLPSDTGAMPPKILLIPYRCVETSFMQYKKWISARKTEAFLPLKG